MVDAMIDLVLNELYRAVRDEVGLLRGVKQEIENLGKELIFMRAFLRYVDVQKKKNSMLESWVEEVRDVAFEIEVAMDDYVLRVAHGDGADTGDAHNTCLGRICSPFRKLKGKRQIGSDLRSIKEKVKEIAERPKRYGYDLSQVNLHEQGSNSSTGRDRLEIDLFRRRSAALVDESKLVGIDQTKKELVDFLNDGDLDLKVVSIVGMGGLGKTALARQIFREMSHFQRRAFVTVSQTLNEEDFVKDMMQQLFLKKEMLEMQNLPIDRLIEGIRDGLKDESFLIVVDDVWRSIHWDQIKVLFPRNKHGSRVVVTTRMEHVAKHSSREYNKGDLYRLQPLSNDASWELFCKHTFPKTQTCPSNLVDMCQDIVFNKCMGVPIAILAISGLLRNKVERELDAWVKNVQRSLGIELKDNEELEMTKKILSLSFDDLPDELKPCYMYLSIFPEDYKIKWERVIRLWISEGFVAKRDEKTVEEDADSYLWELVNRNLIQIAQTKNDGTKRPMKFRIHDFLREIVLSKSKQERFVEVMSKAQEMEIRARRLSFHDHHDALKRLSQPFPIRSLVMFFPTRGVHAKLANDGLKLRLLGMLDLEGAPLDYFPEEICTLLLLRYLNLSDTKVSNIPESIGNLARLETLDLMDTEVTELPDQISMLQKLRHLLTPGAIVTANTGGLVWLQELWFIEVPEKSEWMKALGNLTQLRKLGLVNLKAQHWRELCSSISRMRNLRYLRLETKERFELEYLGSPPAGLEELVLEGELEELPSWMSPSSLRNLQVLTLYKTRLKKDPGATLGSFPNLAGLFLYGKALEHGVKMRVLLPASFPSLKIFRLVPLVISSEGVIDEVAWKRAISDRYPFSECPIVLDIVIPLT